MAKYFYDTEFLEGTQKSFFGQSKPTIDLISIGIVAEDGREYYAISKDFNLKEAWNRYDVQERTPYEKQHGFSGRKIYWIRENVLTPIFFELAEREFHNIHFKDEWTYKGKVVDLEVFKSNKVWISNFKWFKKLINKYGKTNKQIANEVKNFCYYDKETRDGGGQFVGRSFIPNKYPNIEFYGYYSAYDHVTLCWLFGKMIDLPKGFPMYTIDLKQELDNKSNEMIDRIAYESGNHTIWDLGYALKEIKKLDGYPKQTNEHNSLSDAKFNLELYKFIQTL